MLGKDLLPKIKATSRSDRFSLNLMKWVRKHQDYPLFVAYTPICCITGQHLPEFNPDKTCASQLYIGLGNMDDGWLHGSRLSEIICNGTAATSFAYPPRMNFQIIDHWWGLYLAKGKCAIDPEHSLYYDRERWEEQGNSRLCLWCGEFRQEKQTHLVERQGPRS